MSKTEAMDSISNLLSFDTQSLDNVELLLTLEMRSNYNYALSI